MSAPFDDAQFADFRKWRAIEVKHQARVDKLNERIGDLLDELDDEHGHLSRLVRSVVCLMETEAKLCVARDHTTPLKRCRIAELEELTARRAPIRRGDPDAKAVRELRGELDAWGSE